MATVSDGMTVSGRPGRPGTFRAIRRREPTASRTMVYNTSSAVVPVLLILDIISLRRTALNMSVAKAPPATRFVSIVSADPLEIQGSQNSGRLGCRGRREASAQPCAIIGDAACASGEKASWE